MSLLKLPRTVSFEELKVHLLSIENDYNNSPHETVGQRTPNMVYYNQPRNARELLYSSYESLQEQVESDAAEGHRKYIRTLLRKSQNLYNQGNIANVGETVMVLHGRAYKKRIQVVRTYLGAGVITRRDPRNAALSYVRWLNTGTARGVVAGQESEVPYPNQYV